MAQNVATSIVNLKSAGRGASGDTAITGVRRMAHRVTGSGRKLHGEKMPSDYRSTYGDPIVSIETTSQLEYDGHQVVNIEEKLIVKFDDFDGGVTRTYERVRIIIGGDSLFPGPEEDGPAGVREILFQVLEKQPGDGLDTAWSDVRDA